MSCRSIHDVRQDDKTHLVEQDQHDRNFDLVKIKNSHFGNVKSIIFTKLGSPVLVKIRCAQIYKIVSRSDGNLMPYKKFKTFTKSTIDTLHATK